MANSQTRMRSAVLGVLTPLARMMLNFGLDARDATALVRTAFVRAAQKELDEDEKPASISEVARHTRLTRQVVSSIVNDESALPDSEALSIPVEATELASWHSLDEYLDDQGMPMPLAIGPGPRTFAELAAVSGPDESYTYLLDRLLRAGCIAKDENQKVRPVRRDFLVTEDLPRVISIGLTPLAETMVRNWNSPRGSGLCQRVAHSLTIDPAKVGQLRRISRSRISHFVEEFDDVIAWAEEESDDAIVDSDAGESVRIGVGAYYFEVKRSR